MNMEVQDKTEPTPRFLVLDDERSMRDFLSIMLQRKGYEVVTASSGNEALSILDDDEAFDVAIVDLKMPQIGGMEVLKEIRRRYLNIQVVIITAFATTATALEAMKLGAYDYLIKPFKVEEISVVLEKALEKNWLLKENLQLRQTLLERYSFSNIIGRTKVMEQVFSFIAKVCRTNTNILISGESGTGKELVARAIHVNSQRNKGPFVVVNCGAIPENLMESELFGHVRGSFTGAISNKTGILETAHGGTVLLDEIGELPLSLQVKLLRFLQEKNVRRVGDLKDRIVDVRVVAATNRDLEQEVRQGAFREDLYYRLNVIQVTLPPLRDRKGDIPLLATHFFKKFTREMGKELKGISPEAMQIITGYSYPGNVREMENVIEHAVAMEEGAEVSPPSLPLAIRDMVNRPPSPDVHQLPEQGLKLDEMMDGIERELLIKALERTRGSKNKAAKLLGISFRSFRYRLDKHGLG